MNKLSAIITGIQQSGVILLIDAKVKEHCFSALLIDAVETHNWIFVGAAVNLVFKETEVSLAKNLSGLISTRNRMKCKVRIIERGELISKVTLDFNGFTIVSAITSRSVEMLSLSIDDEIEALVKSNEVSLMKA